MYDVDIDDEQEYKFVKPIFDALAANNAPLELMKKVFFDIRLPQYFEYLPHTLQNDPVFLKEGLENNLVSIKDLPPNLQNQDFISKELYINNVSVYLDALDLNIYPQDEEIVFAVLSKSEVAHWQIEEQFKNNAQLMMKCITANEMVYRFVNENIRQQFISNEEEMKELLKTQPQFFSHMKEERKYDADVLKCVLETDKGYSYARQYLRKTRDPEVALMALKITDSARKDIHQIYSSVLKNNGVKEHCHNFLKLYLAQKQLDADLPRHDDSPRVPKTKI